MSASYRTKVLLAMRSGNICALDDCKKTLSEDGIIADPAVIGEAAHIYGENPGTDKKPTSARYRKDMKVDERNHFDNLIYLCPGCHTKIDKQEDDYPAEWLIQRKAEHESWVADQLDLNMDNITFAELEVAAKAISSGNLVGSNDRSVIPPEEKIKKNKLSVEVKSYISMGLSKSGEVTTFLSQMSQLDDDYANRLVNGFKEKYNKFKGCMNGDELFFAMLKFAQSGHYDFKYQSAVLALLSHLFHICEVFEK
jgi:hypothetical protein